MTCDPDYANAWNRLGQAYSWKGELQVFENDHQRKVIRVIPDDVREEIERTLCIEVSFGNLDDVISVEKVIYFLKTHPYWHNGGRIDAFSIDKASIESRWNGMIEKYHNGQVALKKRSIEVRSEIPIMTERDFLVGY